MISFFALLFGVMPIIDWLKAYVHAERKNLGG